jgi:hypothetical protein
MDASSSSSSKDKKFSLDNSFAFYASYHQNFINKIIHIFCVWPIFFTFLVFLCYTEPYTILKIGSFDLPLDWPLIISSIYFSYYAVIEQVFNVNIIYVIHTLILCIFPYIYMYEHISVVLHENSFINMHIFLPILTAWYCWYNLFWPRAYELRWSQESHQSISVNLEGVFRSPYILLVCSG